MEGLFNGERGAGFVAFGIVNSAKKNPGDGQDAFLFEAKISEVLSLLANLEAGAFVPGIDDLVFWNQAEKTYDYYFVTRICGGYRYIL